MKKFLLAAIICSAALPAFASSKGEYWTDVWDKSVIADTPESIKRYFYSDSKSEETHYIAEGQLYRLAAGLPIDPVAKIATAFGVKRWVGPNSSCTPEDQRQYLRWDMGRIDYVSGSFFFYATFHRVRGKDWDPCATPMKPWDTRMEQPLKTEFSDKPFEK